MKTKILFYALLLTGLAVAQYSCAVEADKPERSADNTGLVPLQVQTNIRVSEETEALKTRTFVPAFDIGLYVTTGNLGQYYDGIEYHNVRYNVLNNIFSRFIYLSSNNAKIYAYYPYRELGFDILGENIPIDLSEHEFPSEFLYGTHNEIINNSNPVVRLELKHALTPVFFRFKLTNYTGKGVLTKVQLFNGNKKYAIRRTANINIQTGLMTANPRDLIDPVKEMNYTIPAEFPTDESQFVKFAIIPVGAKADAEGDIFARITIDGKEYTYLFPAGTEWKSDTKYTYSITLNGKKLSPQISEKSFSQEENASAEI